MVSFRLAIVALSIFSQSTVMAAPTYPDKPNNLVHSCYNLDCDNADSHSDRIEQEQVLSSLTEGTLGVLDLDALELVAGRLDNQDHRNLRRTSKNFKSGVKPRVWELYMARQRHVTGHEIKETDLNNHIYVWAV